MSELHAAVTHRLAELRAVAEAATPGPWRHIPARAVVRAEQDICTAAHWDAQQMVVWQPANSLRWIEWAEDVARRHAPVVENVEWWDCPDTTGKAAVCSSCGNRDPNEYDLGVSNYRTKPDDWVSAYVLWPCDEFTGLCRALDIEVSG